MNITVVAVGTRGDVEPHAALCRALLRSGYHAKLCAPADFAESAHALKIPFHPIPVHFRRLIGSPEGGALLASQANGFRFLRELSGIATSVAGEINNSIREACRDASAVCHSPLGLAARFFAHEMGIPAIATFLQPLGFTRERPSPIFSPPQWAPHALNGASHLLVEELFWLVARPLLRKYVQERLPRFGFFASQRNTGSQQLFAYSSSLVPRPTDWTPAMHVTGYWTLRRDTSWCPPATLLDFLADGAPPVCIGFGSMQGPRIDAILAAALRVIADAGRRAIVLTGWSGRPVHHVRSDRVYVMDSAPHDWLFPRVSSVIHHGGAGTTSAALRAGARSVILPIFFDQAFWGKWLHARGLGPAPIPSRRFSADAIRHAIAAAETDAPMRLRVRQLARHLRREDGADNAVTAIGEILECRTGMVRKTG